MRLTLSKRKNMLNTAAATTTTAGNKVDSFVQAVYTQTGTDQHLAEHLTLWVILNILNSLFVDYNLSSVYTLVNLSLSINTICKCKL